MKGTIVAPGDVVLFHNPKFNIMTALIHLTTRSKWNHAALVTEVFPQVEIIEATDKGVTRAKLSDKRDHISIIHVSFEDEDDRYDAVAWAQAREGTRYGYFNAFMCGVNNVLVGLGLVIKKTDAIICSELVAEALEKAGFDFKKDSSQVSPGDLATFFKVPR
jgi:uncharacterized protein YycO